MSAFRPSVEEETVLLRRLYAGEADATADFAEAFLEPLIGALHVRFTGLADSTLVDNMVIDALLRFPQQLDRYDTARSSLWSYLYRDALGDIINAYQREKRAQAGLRMVSLTDVVESYADGNESIEDTIIRHELLTYLPDGVEAATVFAEVEQILLKPRDREFVLLLLTGERRTEPYARILGADDLPVTEQRKRVNGEKDRWRKRLQRLGAKLNDS